MGPWFVTWLGPQSSGGLAVAKVHWGHALSLMAAFENWIGDQTGTGGKGHGFSSYLRFRDCLFILCNCDYRLFTVSLMIDMGKWLHVSIKQRVQKPLLIRACLVVSSLCVCGRVLRSRDASTDIGKRKFLLIYRNIQVFNLSLYHLYGDGQTLRILCSNYFKLKTCFQKLKSN